MLQIPLNNILRFEFRVFLFPRKISIHHIILPIAGCQDISTQWKRYIGFCFFRSLFQDSFPCRKSSTIPKKDYLLWNKCTKTIFTFDWSVSDRLSVNNQMISTNWKTRGASFSFSRRSRYYAMGFYYLQVMPELKVEMENARTFYSITHSKRIFLVLNNVHSITSTIIAPIGALCARG